MQDQLLLDESLERAACSLGDITAPVMARFYGRYPQALEVFERLGLGGRERLEAEMVENALYCAMTWPDRPDEIRIQIGSSVPHHEETLKVASPWYRGLLETVIDVVAETIPGDRAGELALWMRIRRELVETIEGARPTVRADAYAVA